MDILKEYRSIIILIMLAAIIYLLVNTEMFKKLHLNMKLNWSTMSRSNKTVAVIIILVLAYYYWNREE